jgi:hypothetical protein
MKAVKKAILLRGAGVLAFLFCLLASVAPSAAYDRKLAWDYAFNWYKSYHPDYVNYLDEQLYDEDANFVSQALIAGGLLRDASMSFYVDSAGCIPNRAGLYDYLEQYEHAEKTIVGSGDAVPNSFWPGDVVFFGVDAPYDGIVGIYQGNDLDVEPLIAYHSNTSGPAVGYLRGIDEMRLVYGKEGKMHFFHFPTPEETPNNQNFFGTGFYFGPNALSTQVIRPGNNYLGHIVSDTNHSYQDMAIGTDTSQPQFTGCSYLISGYCCDPSKHIPTIGQGFGQPWTSDSPADWAYWVRQAVVYAVQNGSEAWQVRDAVWYITSRVGSPNEIVQAINFPSRTALKQELQNGSFETGGRVAPPWIGKKLASADGRVRKGAHTGAYSFRMAGNRSTKTVKQTLQLSGAAGDAYTLSAWSKARDALPGGGPYELRIKIFYEGGGSKTYKQAFTKNTHKWQQRLVTFEADQNYSKLEVSLVYGKQGGTVWFDDVQLTNERVATAAQTMGVSTEKQ